MKRTKIKPLLANDTWGISLNKPLVIGIVLPKENSVSVNACRNECLWPPVCVARQILAHSRVRWVFDE
jgi:hypothetical protein